MHATITDPTVLLLSPIDFVIIAIVVALVNLVSLSIVAYVVLRRVQNFASSMQIFDLADSMTGVAEQEATIETGHVGPEESSRVIDDNE